MFNTVPHPSPSAPKSYRDVAVRGSQPAMGSSSSIPEVMFEPTLTSAHVELLQRRFPKRVTITSEKFATSTAAWSNALIGKCLGRDVPSDLMISALSPQWPTIGEWELFPMANGYHVFRFSSTEARDEVLFGGPWIVDGAVLALSPFDPVFRPSADQVLRAVVWVRLPELPPGFWSDEIISDILMGVGRVVRLDEHTRLRTRGRFARAAVEVDLRLPLEPGITVGVENGVVLPFWQSFQYEHIHLFCVRCRCVGHKAQNCGQPPDVSIACGSQQGSGDAASSSSAIAVDLPGAWAASMMVRRHQHRSPSGDGEDTQQKFSRPSNFRRSNGTRPKASSQHPKSPSQEVTPTHVGIGPTVSVQVGQLSKSPSQEVITSHVRASTLPESSSRPFGIGLAVGPKCLSSLTSAIGPKPTELSSSDPSPQATGGPSIAGDGTGGNAIDEECDDEDRMIQEILLEDADEDDALEFAIAGKKKKQGKGKMKEVCLRLEPRNRTLKKKVKVGGGFGAFSLLQDLAGDVTVQQLIDRYGPSSEGMM